MPGTYSPGWECLYTGPLPREVVGLPVTLQGETPVFVSTYLLTYLNYKECNFDSFPSILGPQVLRCMIEEPEISSGIDYHDSPFTIGMKNLLVCISGVTNLSRKVYSLLFFFINR